MGIEITTGEEGPRKKFITLIDTRDNSQFEIQTRSEQEFSTAEPARFIFPIDAAEKTQAETIVLPNRDLVVWDVNNKSVHSSTTDDQDIKVDDGQYNLELTGTAMKIYFAVSGSFSITCTDQSLVIEFDTNEDVAIGARSFHDTPETIIYTSDDPAELSEAVSYFGATIDESTPDRSYPTFRHHPPLVRSADTLDIPDYLKKPDTGITLRVPPSVDEIVRVTSLAYYLGAEVQPDETITQPVLATSTGFQIELDGRNEDHKVNQVLEKVVFLDCMARSGQLYDWDLLERRQLDGRISLPFADIYEQPLAARVESYLTTDYTDLRHVIPEWPLTVTIDPTESRLELLPLIAHELAHVNVLSEDTTTNGMKNGFKQDLVRTDRVGTSDHVWAAPGYPLRENKITAEAYRESVSTKLIRSPRTKMVVASNVADQQTIQSYYDLTNWFNMDFELQENVSQSELKDLIAEPAGVFQYIGEVTEEGFRCSDGYLDTRNVFEANATTFLLHGCRTIKHAENLLDRGCYAGITTDGDPSNLTATEFGRALGKLLITGFPLRTAARVVSRVTDYSPSYTILGDGGIPVRQSASSGCPTLLELEANGYEDEFRAWLNSYVNRSFAIGSTFTDKFDVRSTTSLNPTRVGPFTLSREELTDELEKEVAPVSWDGHIYLSNESLFKGLPGLQAWE